MSPFGRVTASVVEQIVTRQKEAVLPLQRTPSINPDRNLVVVICQRLNSRVAKIGRSVRVAGYRCVLIMVNPDWTGHRVEHEFDECHHVTNFTDYFEVLGRYDPIVYHPVLQTMNAEMVLLAPFLFSPDRVVVDFYDPVHPSVNPQRFERDSPQVERIQKAYRTQRFAYDHARGICTRLMLPKLTRSWKPDYAQRRVFYPEPVWVDRRPQVQRLSERDGKLHITFIGNFEPTAPPEQEFGGFMWLAERCEALGIHFHLHCSRSHNSEHFGRYWDLARRSAHFHIERYVGLDELTGILATYDAGITPILPPDIRTIWHTNRALHPRGNWGGKLAEYVDARLFTIASWKHWAMARMTMHYGVGEAPHPKTLIERDYWQRLPEKIAKAREQIERIHPKISIQAQAPRLRRLYQEVDKIATAVTTGSERERTLQLNCDL